MNWPAAYSVVRVLVPGVPAAADLGRIIFVPEYVAAAGSAPSPPPTVFIATAGPSAPFYTKPGGSQPPFGTALNMTGSGKKPLPSSSGWASVLIVGSGADVASPSFVWSSSPTANGLNLVDIVSPSLRTLAGVTPTVYNTSSLVGRRRMLAAPDADDESAEQAVQPRSASKARKLLMWNSLTRRGSVSRRAASTLAS